MRLKLNDISPDGVRIVINWDAFVVGTSVFVPCINTKQAMNDIVDASGSMELECGVTDNNYM